MSGVIHGEDQSIPFHLTLVGSESTIYPPGWYFYIPGEDDPPPNEFEPDKKFLIGPYDTSDQARTEAVIFITQAFFENEDDDDQSD